MRQAGAYWQHLLYCVCALCIMSASLPAHVLHVTEPRKTPRARMSGWVLLTPSLAHSLSLHHYLFTLPLFWSLWQQQALGDILIQWTYWLNGAFLSFVSLVHNPIFSPKAGVASRSVCVCVWWRVGSSSVLLALQIIGEDYNTAHNRFLWHTRECTNIQRASFFHKQWNLSVCIPVCWQ